MYNINEVTQVNASFIFFHFPDGTQDRKTVDIRELKHLYTEICENMKHYEFMKMENNKISNNIQEEYDKLDNTILGYKAYIEKNQDNSSIRRGLHDVCYQLEVVQKKQSELAIQKSGVNIAWSYAMEKYWKLYTLKKQIENVLKVI
jgi:hypothetical protein